MDNTTINQQLYNLAMQAISSGNFPKALEYCQQILNSFPDYTPAIQLSGIAHLQMNQFTEAKQAFLKAIALEPDNAVFYTNLGEISKRQNQLDEAIQYLEKAVSLNPQFAGAKYNLANTYKVKGDYQKAVNLYQEAMALEPENPQYSYNLANTLFELSYYQEAAMFYQKTIALEPGNSHAYYNFGLTLWETGKYGEAIFNFLRAVHLNPDYKEAYRSLCISYESQSRYDEAKDIYKVLLEKEPENTALRFHIDTLHPLVNLTNYEIEAYGRSLEKFIEKYQIMKIKLNDIHENIHPSSTLIYQGRNYKQLLEKYAGMFEGVFPSYTNEPKSKKIGFVVTGGHAGIFAKFMCNIINRLPADFEIKIICPENEYINKVKPMLKNNAVSNLHLPEYIEDAAKEISKENFSLLYHWEVGSDTMNYFLPMLKLAPVQCTSLGWPGTTGLKKIDFFISSVLIENENAQEHYTENLVKFRNLPFIYDKPVIPQGSISLAEFDITPENNLYLCVQNLRKVHPDFDELVGNILRKDSKGVVVFVSDKHSQITELIRTRLRVTQPEVADRIRFLPRLSMEQYLLVIKQADVLLDTIYFGGANTTYEAMAAGTPVITMPWELERGRYTYGAYKLMDMEQCIASSKEQYVELAVNIATDKSYRQQLSNEILLKNSVLFNNYEVLEEYIFFFKKYS